MKRLTVLLTAICLAPLMAGGILLKDLVDSAREPALKLAPWLFGPASARWTITEFADLECPYCKTYTPELKRWVSQQADVNLQWHHLPLPFHGPAALYQARFVECAGVLGDANTFWEAVDQVLQRTRGNGQGFDGHLDVTGIDKRDLEDCADKNFAVAQQVEAQIQEAASKGINATPTLLVTDNSTGKSVKLEGPADGPTLLSTIDWLATQSARSP